MSKKIEFGDFQTPIPLAEKCARRVAGFFNPDHIIEPMCGLGHFLEASSKIWGGNVNYSGYEINKAHLKEFEKRCSKLYKRANVKHADFFKLDVRTIFSKEEAKRGSKGHNFLIIGNPPWVTNSQLSILNSKNLPEKYNVKGYSGFEALLGKSNFDISEWMLLKLTKEIKEKHGVLAMLCKTSVARNIFLHNFKTGHKDVSYKIIRIDSKKEFGVSVDACLFIADYFNGGDESKCEIFENFDDDKPVNRMGIENKKLVANIDLYLKTQQLVSGVHSEVQPANTWRSGIKHDASKVMEIKLVGDKLINGFGEKVLIETDYLYPLLKSSNLANNRLLSDRYVIVTQKKIGQETASIKESAPLLWKYLSKYSSNLDGRKSSIYRRQPRFSIFGIGDYSFKPYKIAISGLYKKINFCLLKPQDNKPIMVDDTCYLLGFDKLDKAEKTLELLNSQLVSEHISSLIFWDSKRPINSSVYDL